MTRKQLVLHLLRDAGQRGISTSEFLQAGCGSRFGGRVQELREDGHVIEAARVSESSWRYTLTRDAERDAGDPEGRFGHAESTLSSLSGHADVSLGAAAPPPAPDGAECPATSADGSPAPSSRSAGPQDAPPLTPLFDPDRPRQPWRDYDPEDRAA